ncbi:hypothetical protein [Gracilimonas sp.]|uniref:hypothetical protein n=1 Tax=Gracilimonas sp. TaxID=1974203 RepID=UPI0028725A4B|nr:hypothetical protein [Gracilimonas sp.]
MKKLYISIAMLALILGSLFPANVNGRFLDECEDELCFYGVKECVDAKPQYNYQCIGADDNCDETTECSIDPE